MIYVDNLVDYKTGFGPSCHLVSDSLEELEEFAASLGMKPKWLQMGAGGAVPHYDLTPFKRKLAITKGAKEITRKDLYQIIQKYKQALKNK